MVLRSVGLILLTACLVAGKLALIYATFVDSCLNVHDVACEVALPPPTAPKAPSESPEVRTHTTALLNWLEPQYVYLANIFLFDVLMRHGIECSQKSWLGHQRV